MVEPSLLAPVAGLRSLQLNRITRHHVQVKYRSYIPQHQRLPFVKTVARTTEEQKKTSKIRETIFAHSIIMWTGRGRVHRHYACFFYYTR